MNHPKYIAGIGASAGGLSAFIDFFENIPDRLGISFVVIQHLPPSFETHLDEIIARHSKLPVKILTQDELPLADHIYILPGSLRVILKKGKLVLRKRQSTEILNTAIDEFFISLAKEKRKNAIGIILSGMNADGSVGVKKIAENHGILLVQDPASTEYKVMPTAAILADDPEVLPPKEIGNVLSERIRARRLRRKKIPMFINIGDFVPSGAAAFLIHFITLSR